MGSRSAPMPPLSYQVTTDGDSGIVNEMNLRGREQGEPRCIPDLAKHFVPVSSETMAIVQGMPDLWEAE